MTDERREQLRKIMSMAWSLYRSRAIPGSTVSTFATALRNAWAWVKRQSATAAPVRVVAMRSMLRSPIRRALTGQRYADRRAWDAGYLTSHLGA